MATATTSSADTAIPLRRSTESTAFTVLAAISFSHLLNDTIQSLIPALYPILKTSFALNFSQVGLMTLTLMLTASLLQPVVGLYTDRRPAPYSLVVGMGFSLVGLLLLSVAGTFGWLLAAAGLVGVGSSVFHPESSRIARMASGGRHGLAQSLFQVGGNVGSSFGPLLAAFLVAPRGQSSIAWCSLVALLGMIVLWRIGNWHSERRSERPAARSSGSTAAVRPGDSPVSRRRVIVSLAILAALIFSKYFYLASLNSYYTFYLISRFHVSVRTAQVDLFRVSRRRRGRDHPRRSDRRSARAANTSSGARSSASFRLRCSCRTPVCSGRRS